MPDFAEPTRPPRLGRRTLMRGAGLGVFGVASVAVLPLFGTDGAAQDPATCVAKDVSDVDKKLIVNVTVFDVYEGTGVEPGKKSIAIAVTIQPRDKTMTDQEIDALGQKVVAEVAKRTGGVLRG